MRVKLAHVQLELQLPGVLRWLEALKPDVIVYDPIICREGANAGILWDSQGGAVSICWTGGLGCYSTHQSIKTSTPPLILSTLMPGRIRQTSTPCNLECEIRLVAPGLVFPRPNLPTTQHNDSHHHKEAQRKRADRNNRVGGGLCDTLWRPAARCC